MSGTATPPPTRNQSKVEPKNINRALNSLLKWHNSKRQNQKTEPFENDGFVYLVVTLKKPPEMDRTNPVMITLPHPLINLNGEDTPELCLIVDDKHKNKITKEAALKKIQAENIPISDVIKVSKLKSELKKLEKEEKRFEVYFAERRLMTVLPKLLGKKKSPVGLSLRKSDWKEQVERVCESALFFVGTGTCSVVKVAKLSMEKEEIEENVAVAMNGIADSIPGKWRNVKLFHLKLLESLALPVYQSGRKMETQV